MICEILVYPRNSKAAAYEPCLGDSNKIVRYQEHWPVRVPTTMKGILKYSATQDCLPIPTGRSRLACHCYTWWHTFNTDLCKLRHKARVLHIAPYG